MERRRLLEVGADARDLAVGGGGGCTDVDVVATERDRVQHGRRFRRALQEVVVVVVHATCPI